MRELVVAALQTGGASLVALGLAVIATKVFALVLGPAGVGLVSLVRQTYQSALILGTLNGQMAVAQGIASREGDARAEYPSTVFWVLLVASGTAVLVLLVFPSQISRFVMGRDDQASAHVIRWLSLAVIGGASAAFLSGVLAGYRAIGRIALLQIAGAAVAAALAYPVALLLRGGHTLALAAQVAVPALAMAAMGLVFVMRGGWAPSPLHRVGRVFDLGTATGFLRLAAAMLFSGALATAIPLAIRAFAVRRFGLSGVGHFDVAWTISMNYVLLAVASFSTYYVPSLSRLKEACDRQELIHRVLRLSIVLMVPLVVALAVLKPVLVGALYSLAFLPALEIIRWMLIGDYFKVTSWVFAATMIAYADVKTFVWTEIVWGGISIGGSALSILHLNALQGVGANFMFVYTTYLVFALAYVGSRRHFILDARIASIWLIGLALILAASAQTWSDLAVRPALAAAYIGMATYFSWTVLTPGERQWIGSRLHRTVAWKYAQESPRE